MGHLKLYAEKLVEHQTPPCLIFIFRLLGEVNIEIGVFHTHQAIGFPKFARQKFLYAFSITAQGIVNDIAEVTKREPLGERVDRHEPPGMKALRHGAVGIFVTITAGKLLPAGQT